MNWHIFCTMCVSSLKVAKIVRAEDANVNVNECHLFFFLFLFCL